MEKREIWKWSQILPEPAFGRASSAWEIRLEKCSTEMTCVYIENKASVLYCSLFMISASRCPLLLCRYLFSVDRRENYSHAGHQLRHWSAWFMLTNVEAVLEKSEVVGILFLYYLSRNTSNCAVAPFWWKIRLGCSSSIVLSLFCGQDEYELFFLPTPCITPQLEE